MIEILRRLLLLGGLTSGLWLCLWSVPFLYRVEPVDWNHERGRLERKSAALNAFARETLGTDGDPGIDAHPETKLDRDAFIAERTEGRLVDRTGPAWEGFFAGMAATASGRAPSDDWSGRIAGSPYTRSLYFRPDEPPLRDLDGGLPDSEANQTYIRIRGKTRDEYLFVHQSDRGDFFGHAPSKVAFPDRAAGVGVILAGVLLYALIPWPRRPESGIYYTRPRATTGLDVVGCVFGAFFFGLPIVVTQANGGSPFSPGWNALTAVFWLLAAILFACSAAAAVYTARQVEWTPRGLACSTLFGRTTRTWDEIAGVDPYEVPQIPRWLRSLLFLVSLLNWRALGPALMFGGREPGFRIAFRTGKPLSFLLKGLSGAVPFVGRIRALGAPVAAGVYAALGRKPDDPAFDGPFPRPPSGLGFAAFIGIVAAGLAALLVLSLPAPTPAAPADALPATAYAIPSDDGPSWETLRKNQELLHEMEGISREMDRITERMKTADPADRPALQAEFSRLVRKFQELSAQTDRNRDPEGPAEKEAPDETDK